MHTGSIGGAPGLSLLAFLIQTVRRQKYLAVYVVCTG